MLLFITASPFGALKLIAVVIEKSSRPARSFGGIRSKIVHVLVAVLRAKLTHQSFLQFGELPRDVVASCQQRGWSSHRSLRQGMSAGYIVGYRSRSLEDCRSNWQIDPAEWAEALKPVRQLHPAVQFGKILSAVVRPLERIPSFPAEHSSITPVRPHGAASLKKTAKSDSC